jgi:hypothetical protein
VVHSSPDIIYKNHGRAPIWKGGEFLRQNADENQASLLVASDCGFYDGVTSLPGTRGHEEERLRSPAIVRGFIGGESQDHYEIRARKGQTLAVSISWKRKTTIRRHSQSVLISLPTVNPLPEKKPTTATVGRERFPRQQTI